MGTIDYSFKSCPRKGASASKGKATEEDIKVSSHAPARGHHTAIAKMLVGAAVSSHAPARGHRLLFVRIGSHTSFKSCPRKGASLNLPTYTASFTSFKSCPRKGASFPRWPVRVTRKQFQVMPPQGGIGVGVPCVQMLRVSSHAPARGHLTQAQKLSSIQMQFQVMPPQGGIRWIHGRGTWRRLCFKSCPRKGASGLLCP